MEKRWVQHMSGQGEKHEVAGDNKLVWQTTNAFLVPKSEYGLCEGPEVWREVTKECEVEGDDWPRIVHRLDGGCTSDVRQVHFYRITKVQLKRDLPPSPHGTFMIPHPTELVWAFIIEHKKPCP